MSDGEPPRCWWSLGSTAYRAYHDGEWGRPCHDEKRLFELLILEGAQAGLSWSTILNKREGYRAVFDGFDARRMAAYTDEELAQKLGDARIVRNRLKVSAARTNAQAYLKLCEQHGSLESWLWKFVDGQPVLNHWQEKSQVPATTPLSDAISKALQGMGFKFVGSTIIYAWLQATGVVNDHLSGCFCHPDNGANSAVHDRVRRHQSRLV